MKLKVTRKGHSRIERTRDGKRTMHYAPGDTFTGTERELEAFGDRLEQVEDDKPKRKPKPKTDTVADEPNQTDSPDGN